MINQERPETHEIEMEDTPEQRAAFHISIFGTGGEKTPEDQAAVQHAEQLARDVVGRGFSIATGGFDVGVMKAATRAAVEEGKKRGRTEAVAKGFTVEGIELLPAPGAEIVKSKTLIERFGHLIDESQAYVVLGGRFGTIGEMIAAIDAELVRMMPKEKPKPRPIIIVDSTGEHLDTLLATLEKDPRMREAEVLRYTYYFAGVKGWDEYTGRIIELYYKQSLGKTLSEDERALLEKANLKTRYDVYAK